MANKPTGKPSGRPTKYDAKTHPVIVLKLAERGLTEEEMANVLGVARSNFSEWKNKYPEFRDAIAEGKQNPIRDVEDALFKLCKGYTYREENNLGMKVEKVKHPDVRAIQFYLKNVASDKWRDKQEVEHTGPDGGPIQTFDIASLPKEERDTLLKELWGE